MSRRTYVQPACAGPPGLSECARLRATVSRRCNPSLQVPASLPRSLGGSLAAWQRAACAVRCALCAGRACTTLDRCRIVCGASGPASALPACVAALPPFQARWARCRWARCPAQPGCRGATAEQRDEPTALCSSNHELHALTASAAAPRPLSLLRSVHASSVNGCTVLGRCTSRWWRACERWAAGRWAAGGGLRAVCTGCCTQSTQLGAAQRVRSRVTRFLGAATAA